MDRLTYVRRRLASPGRARWVFAALRVRWLRCWSLREFRLYAMSAADLPLSNDGDELRRDAVDDLVLYRPSSAGDLPASDFLAQAKERLALGHHVYTWAEGGVLLHYAWLEERTERAGSDFHHEFPLGGPAAVLWNDYTWPAARGRGLQTRSIQRRLRDAAAAGHERMFIGVLADNTPSRHNIEKLGFRYCASGWARYRFGRVRLWITYASSGVASGPATPGDMRARS
jgi:GNAT superfamily N-acetyltransferase